MEGLLWFIVGAGLTFASGILLVKADPEKYIKKLVELLRSKLGDEQADKVSNNLGLYLVDAGIDFITTIEDEELEEEIMQLI
jgi:hypothetical protein